MVNCYSAIVYGFHLYELVQFVENNEICEFRDPKWVDVKLAQAKYLLSRLAEFRDLVSGKFDCIPSVIVAGDFNSTPGDKVQFCFLGRLYPYLSLVSFGS